MRGFLVVLACLLWAVQALAEGLERSATPDWVDDLPLPAVDDSLKERALDGVHYILSDHQIRWNGPIREAYGRTALMVTDRAGLERAATLSFDYDPRLDRVILTRLVVIRDGREIDLRDSLHEEVLRRETRLDEGIIDGTLTAWLQIPDLRVGDIVDYSTLRVMQPLIPEGERFGASTLEWGVPVQLSRTVLYWPEAWMLQTAPVPERISHFVAPKAVDGIIRHEWQKVNHIPMRWEDNIPPGQEPEAVLRFSAYADWGEISAALAPHYAADYPLSPEWEARVAAIATAHPDLEGRAIAALRMVQDELRYVSLSVGAGGIFARLPQEVIASGFGDCKDKALLLVALLRRLGVEAVVALTDIDSGQSLPMEVPSLGAFDHAIVRIRVDGRTHWVDPTGSHQGGDFATMTPPDYGWALPLTGPDQADLEAIPTTPARAWSTDVTETFLFGAMGVLIEVRSIYGGGAADSMRAKWATTPADLMTEDYLAYYQGRYPGLTLIRGMEKMDDRARNRLEMVERYLLPASALRGTDLEQSFPFGTEDFAANLPDRLTGPRVSPLEAGSAAEYRHHVRVLNAPLEFVPPAPEVLDNPAFRFEFTARVPGPGHLELDWVHVRKGNDVAPEDVARVIDAGGRVYDLTWFTWDVTPEPG